MANVAVVGAQWGDEGKGKIVDWLSRARRRRRALPGRPQCRPHAGRRQRRPTSCRLLPSGVVRRQAVDHRQRRRRRPLGAARRDRDGARRRASRSRPRHLRIADNARADPAAARRARPGARGGRAASGQDRHHRPRHRPGLRGQGRRAARSGSATSPTRRRSTTRLDELLLHHNALLRGLGAPEFDRGAAAGPSCARSRRSCCPIAEPVWQRARRGAPRRPPHPVRGRAGRDARCRPRHLSVRHLVEHGGRPGRGRLRHRPGGDRLRARHHQGLHDAGRLRPVPDRADRRDRPAARRARPRVRHRHRPAAALRLVRRGRWCARRSRSAASTASR